MRTWKEVMPDYQIVCWDTERFDINSNTFVAEAFGAKKWAFAADYIRLHALANHGGIYLDSDVIVRKRFDEFLEYEFFSSMEYHHSHVKLHNVSALLNEDGSSKFPATPIPAIGIQAAILGSVKEHPFLMDCLRWYRDRHFILDDGSYSDKVIMPSILAMIAENYGFRYIDKLQRLDGNIVILPSEIFAGHQEEMTSNSYAIHCCAGSWRDRPRKNLFGTLLRQLQWLGLLGATRRR
jgi:mannosyltransferase OCH1-like enzyme